MSPISNLNYLATVGQCNYYDSFENYKKCGSTGFTIAVGFKYCEKLDASSDFLNDDVFIIRILFPLAIKLLKFVVFKGKLWLNSTRRCLINKLHSYVNLKCDVLDNYAYETILPCILNPGYNSKSFCDIVLNWKNVRALLNAYDFANPLTLNGLNKVKFLYNLKLKFLYN